MHPRFPVFLGPDNTRNYSEGCRYVSRDNKNFLINFVGYIHDDGNDFQMKQRDQLVKFGRYIVGGTLHNSNTFHHRHVATWSYSQTFKPMFATEMDPTIFTLFGAKILKTEISKFLVDEGAMLGSANKDYFIVCRKF